MVESTLRTYHGRDLTIGLQKLDNFALMSWLHASEESSSSDGLTLLLNGQIVKLSASERLPSGGLFLSKHTNAATNGLCSRLVVTSDDNDTDPSMATFYNTVMYLCSWRIQHANNTDESQIALFIKNMLTKYYRHTYNPNGPHLGDPAFNYICTSFKIAFYRNKFYRGYVIYDIP